MVDFVKEYLLSLSDIFKIEINKSTTINNIPVYFLFEDINYKVFSDELHYLVFMERFTKKKWSIPQTQLNTKRNKIINYIKEKINEYNIREEKREKIRFRDIIINKYLNSILKKHKDYTKVCVELNIESLLFNYIEYPLPLVYLETITSSLGTYNYNTGKVKIYPKKGLSEDSPTIQSLTALIKDVFTNYFELDFNNPNHLLIYLKYKSEG